MCTHLILKMLLYEAMSALKEIVNLAIAHMMVPLISENREVKIGASSYRLS